MAPLLLLDTMLVNSRTMFIGALVGTILLSQVSSFAITGFTFGSTFEEPDSPRTFAESGGGSGVVQFQNGNTKFLWGKAEGGFTSSYFNFSGSIYDDSSGSSAAGSLAYFNGDSVANTGVGFVDLNLKITDDVTFDEYDFRFTLQVVNTPNDTPLLDANGDIITDGSGNPIPNLDHFNNADVVRFLNPTIEINPTLFLTLSFGNPGSFSQLDEGGNALKVLEGKEASATVFATLSPTHPSAGVPDGGSNLALFGLAVASISLLRRYRL